MTDELRERAKGIAEFYKGDCSCEQDKPCQTCRLAQDIQDAISDGIMSREISRKDWQYLVSAKTIKLEQEICNLKLMITKCLQTLLPFADGNYSEKDLANSKLVFKEVPDVR